MVKRKKKSFSLEKISYQVTQWVGTPLSIILHTLFFIGIFALKYIGWTLDQILLILTTAVSLEAIYLAIFIQMTVNKQSQSISAVEKDIDEIQEDVEDLQEDVAEDDVVDENTSQKLEKIESGLQMLLQQVESLKKNA